MSGTGTKWLRAALAKTSFRREGDAARDARNWPEAERAYAAHLEGHPTDHRIWIQYGHCLKEQGKHSKAEDSYRKAIAAHPQGSDGPIQLAHLLKRQGRDVEAADMFAAAVRNSGSRAAYIELENLKRNGIDLGAADLRPAAVLQKQAILIELDDLFGYLEAHKTLSGIQRVQAELILWILNVAAGKSDQEYIFVLNPIGENCLWALHNSDLADIVGYVKGAYVDHDRLKWLLAAARGNAVLVAPVAGQCYLVLGAFWGSGGVAGRYFHLKKAGVAIGAYIYDLIPITHPEYCDDVLAHEFALSFGDGLAIFDFLLTISEYTEREVKRYRDRLGMPSMPVKAIPLAHADVSATRTMQAKWDSKTAFLRDRPFVMIVSTIEARKNHAYLVAAWKQFLDEGLDPPDLVFVGRFGWRVTGLMELLRSTHHLDDRVHVLHDLSDSALQTLYDACLFTVFPSFVEGWGLPVGESLAQGKPCIASSTSSIREVGGDLVDYLDPHNLRDGIEVLRKMTFDATYRDARTTAIRARFKPRTWHDVGMNLLSTVEQMRRGLQISQTPEPFFPAGLLFRPCKLAFGQRLPKDYALKPLRLMLAESWYEIENFGCWVRGADGVLKFRTGLAPGTEIHAYLKFCSPPTRGDDVYVTVTVGEPARRTNAARPGTAARTRIRDLFLVRATGMVCDDGLAVIEIRVHGEILPEHTGLDARSFALGLAAVGYAPKADTAARMEIMDELIFDAV